MTQNNYPKGLDELVEKVSEPFVKDMEQYSYYGSNYGIPEDDVADYTRALLNALAERGYVLVDANKQEPVAYIAGYYKDVINGETDAVPLGAEVSFVNMNWPGQIPIYTHPAIPGRVALPDGWKWVPVEPTSEMLYCAEMWDDGFAGAWSRALAAAPIQAKNEEGGK